MVTDEKLSFPVFRRVATMIFVPARSPSSAIEMIAVDPIDLQSAQERHRTPQHHAGADSNLPGGRI